MNQESRLSATIPAELTGQRLDQALSALFKDITRSRLQQWIEDGRVTLNGRAPRKRDKVKEGDAVEIMVPPPVDSGWKAQALPLVFVHEDNELLVINKPPGLVVHPGAGNPEGTLLNALIAHAPKLARLPRAGIVHRLDKDTSGLLVVAKTESARQNLIGQLQEHAVEREYLAIVNGVMVAGGTIEAPIGRHRTQRTRMAVSSQGKPAVSHYRVMKKYRAHTLVQVNLESGRTHQIRVHMAHLHYPVVGDPVYGGRLKIPAGSSEKLKDVLRGFKRQALHALKLSLIHPETGKRVQWATSVPEDMSKLMEALAMDAKAHSD
ncbi:MAG: 23S rRNA pseudouridine(1911/1915/1917) synthase RluD [Sulfuricaulis sp.]|uniref:23S rRNA pseudouridine(1911/1915/1917) synthase RluD n=1 Tax=Sulfuricaulis sp. TaxID=2003553 RepID=UPI0025D232BD|nr:23S rRNA pseudouridine(1911/1915/1917) synthase RluD [Sulfuricaulis sp.]MCR4347965.1 23S rRNA pseudouridine(1911/1915/1917) synthase RluD [Sulfuricaulis sp.]